MHIEFSLNEVPVNENWQITLDRAKIPFCSGVSLERNGSTARLGRNGGGASACLADAVEITVGKLFVETYLYNG